MGALGTTELLVVLLLVVAPMLVVVLVIKAFANRPPTSPAAGSGAARWARDPSHRHELRYWDGVCWTDLVSDQKVESRDPL